MPELYPYRRLAHYPHMKPADVAIWEAYIDAHPDKYEWCMYDVPVGSGPEFNTVVNPETGGDAEKLYQRKIDVVAGTPLTTDIIEVKPRAGTSALGQVQGYLHLYVRDYNPSGRPRAVILTDVISRDMPELAAAAGVVLITP